MFTVEKLHDTEKPKNKNHLLIIPSLEIITIDVLVQFPPRPSSLTHTHMRTLPGTLVFRALDYSRHAL